MYPTNDNSIVANLGSFAQALLYYSNQYCQRFRPTFPVSILPKKIIKAVFPFIEIAVPDDRATEAFQKINAHLASELTFGETNSFPEVSSRLQRQIDEIEVESLEKRLFEGACQRLDLSFLSWTLDHEYPDPLFTAFRSHFRYSNGKSLHDLSDLANTYRNAEAEDAKRNVAKKKYALAVAKLFGFDGDSNLDSSDIAGGCFRSQGLLPNSEMPVWFLCLSSEYDAETQLGLQVSESEKSLFVVILLGDKVASGRRLSLLLRGHYYVSITDAEIVSSTFRSKNQHDIKNKIKRSLPVSMFSPYRFNGAAGETFVGRNGELERILTSINSEFCILGPRKIGKTSLLGEIKKRLISSRFNKSIAIHVDAKSSKKVHQFQRNIHNAFLIQTKPIELFETLDSGEDFFSDFSVQLSKLCELGYRVTFLIDEIDEVLSDDGRPVENFLRSVGNRDLARFVVFGYTTLSRRIKDGSSALYNLFEQIALGPLDHPAALQLVKEPMEELGISFEDSRIPATIVDYCSQIPWLIQYMCQRILESLYKEETITRKLVDDVFGSPEFSRTLTRTILEDESLGPLPQLIVYVFLSQNKEVCTEEELIDAVERRAYYIPYVDIQRGLLHLTETYIFRKTASGYRFFIEQQRRVLNATEDSESKLLHLLRDIGRQYLRNDSSSRFGRRKDKG